MPIIKLQRYNNCNIDFPTPFIILIIYVELYGYLTDIVKSSCRNPVTKASLGKLCCLNIYLTLKLKSEGTLQCSNLQVVNVSV